MKLSVTKNLNVVEFLLQDIKSGKLAIGLRVVNGTSISPEWERGIYLKTDQETIICLRNTREGDKEWRTTAYEVRQLGIANRLMCRYLTKDEIVSLYNED